MESWIDCGREHGIFLTFKSLRQSGCWKGGEWIPLQKFRENDQGVAFKVKGRFWRGIEKILMYSLLSRIRTVSLFGIKFFTLLDVLKLNWSTKSKLVRISTIAMEREWIKIMQFCWKRFKRSSLDEQQKRQISVKEAFFADFFKKLRLERPLRNYFAAAPNCGGPKVTYWNRLGIAEICFQS